MLRGTGWASTTVHADAPLSAGEREEVSEDEPVAVLAVVESAVECLFHGSLARGLKANPLCLCVCLWPVCWGGGVAWCFCIVRGFLGLQGQVRRSCAVIGRMEGCHGKVRSYSWCWVPTAAWGSSCRFRGKWGALTAETGTLSGQRRWPWGVSFSGTSGRTGTFNKGRGCEGRRTR